MNTKHNYSFIILALLLVLCFVVNISLGSVSIPFSEVIKSVFGHSENESWQYIIQDYRLPKAFTAILVGSG
jgi:iron complex transport system permease protein